MLKLYVNKSKFIKVLKTKHQQWEKACVDSKKENKQAKNNQTKNREGKVEITIFK